VATTDTVKDTSSIEDLRARIDEFDAEIARLVAERALVSRHIQELRVRTGGTRTELRREAVVVTRYRQQLGSEGTALGEAVLRVCRGSRNR
jgi:chorismate mutase